VKKPSAQDLWSQENPEFAGNLEREQMISKGWLPTFTRQKTLPMLVAARKIVFYALPVEERTRWKNKANAWRPVEPTR